MVGKDSDSVALSVEIEIEVKKQPYFQEWQDPKLDQTIWDGITSVKVIQLVKHLDYILLSMQFVNIFLLIVGLLNS